MYSFISMKTWSLSCENNTGQNCLSYQGPKIWKSLASDLKSTNHVKTFKHLIKDDVYVYFWHCTCSVMHDLVLFKSIKIQMSYIFKNFPFFYENFSFIDIFGDTNTETRLQWTFSAIPAILMEWKEWKERNGRICTCRVCKWI